MISKEAILRILDENGVRYPADFLCRGKSPASPEAQQISDACIEMIEAYLEYGLNNGFERVAREIAVLADVVVRLSSPTLKPHDRRGLKKQMDKSRESLRRDYIRESLSFPDDHILGISKGVCELVADTRACIGAYRREAAEMTEEGYFELASDAGVPQGEFPAWKEEALSALDGADALLADIAAALSEVMDDSSICSLEQADDIAAKISAWRNDVAYSYLILHGGMNEGLRDALRVAQEWRDRIRGVGRQNPRAPAAKAYAERDQMACYVAALARLPK